jgi:LmbE family N-acetylglucosaminyl deacetylase
MENDSSLNCPGCGALLLANVTPHSVVTTDGERVPFRRHTDHVMCSCMASYRVSDLRQVIAQVEARMRS